MTIWVEDQESLKAYQTLRLEYEHLHEQCSNRRTRVMLEAVQMETEKIEDAE